ncbi:hypothetical protein LSCM1_01957 [Leishmania martiniquensis]|uniref:Uncharacterized protein n=1 Tax=Leishmania martiniquensis TaxID=1580590 RepID=A0A836H4G1_9TRYP|nr:hypothetical protein LSCM1_01957 [Leishmania martiniquensis]
MSWYSSQTLSHTLSGTWRATDGKTIVAMCDGGSAWSGMCSFESEEFRYEGRVLASRLSDGGWAAFLPLKSGNTVILGYRKGSLAVVLKSGESALRKAEYTRSTAQAEDFLATLRLKGKYIGALFVMIGTYKWIQVSFFGASLRRARRF